MQKTEIGVAETYLHTSSNDAKSTVGARANQGEPYPILLADIIALKSQNGYPTQSKEKYLKMSRISTRLVIVDVPLPRL